MDEMISRLFDVPFRWALNNASNSSCLTSDPASNPYPEKHPDIIRYLHSELNLSPGELLFGFGEQFGAFVKNGKGPCLPPYKDLISFARAIHFGLESGRWNFK